MRLITEPYLTQVNNWPKTGRHILAQYDDHSFVQKQRQNIKSDCEQLITPREIVYSVFDSETQEKLRLSAWTE
ncbi:hypothetical protein H1Q63_21735 [Desmonostoc muscorum CCALA 125]|nr:hypothetical protein [Desmonostoc muscorum CCALA 125]